MMGKGAAAVLVVDDDVDTCRNLSDILHDLGHQVDVAHDGPSALELVRRTAYDVALLDYKMPGMDGLTLYREIKKIRAGTVAIVVTAYAGGTTAEEALSAGAWQVLPKPVDFPRLLSLVEDAMTQPLVLISQVQRSGGTLLSQLFDGPPQVHAHPDELKIGGPRETDWPQLDMRLSPDEGFELLFEPAVVRHVQAAGHAGQVQIRVVAHEVQPGHQA